MKTRVLFVFLAAVFMLACTTRGMCADFVEIPFEEGKTPPDAEEGYAWCLVTKPAVLDAVSEKVKVKDATFYVETVSAKYDWVEEVVVTYPAHKEAVVTGLAYTEERGLAKPEELYEYKFIPAKYEDVFEDIVITPEHERITVKAPVFEEKEEGYTVSAPRTEIRSYDCDQAVVTKGDEGKGECYMSVEIPATTDRYVTRTLVEDGSVVREVIPAVTKRVKVRRLVEEARIEKVAIKKGAAVVTRSLPVPQKVEYVDVPAKTETIRKLVEVAPATQQRVDVPAEYKILTRETMTQEAMLVWRKIPLSECGKKAKSSPRALVERYGSLPALSNGLNY